MCYADASVDGGPHGVHVARSAFTPVALASGL